jgi:hypothetical protein
MSRKKYLSPELLDKFDKKKDFNEMSIESLKIIFKFMKGVDLKEHSSKSLANLGKSLITNIRKARKIIESSTTSNDTVESTIKLVDDMFELLRDILLNVEDSYDMGLVEPHERNLIVSFMGEYLKVCNEEENFRTAEEVEEEDEDYSSLVLDGLNVNEILDTFILET